MAEIKIKVNAICPRCDGTEIYRVIEIEDNHSPFKQRIPTSYTACFSLVNGNSNLKEICWYHFVAQKNRTSSPKDKACRVEGCTSSDLMYGRNMCVEHYRQLCREQYHRRVKVKTA